MLDEKSASFLALSKAGIWSILGIEFCICKQLLEKVN
jgi:hypothetical protein